MSKYASHRGLVAKRCVSTVSAGAMLFSTVGIVASPAQAATQSEKIPLAISIGDSFISGEGGRYAGNIYSSSESDGAEDNGPHNKGANVYEDSWGGRNFTTIKRPKGGLLDTSQTCHRSDSAEIKVAAKAYGWTPVNLACSGAKTKDVLTDRYHVERPQIQQLADLANDSKYEIKAVVVSIGGNDLGFSSLISDLVQITETNAPTQQTWGNWLNPFAKKKSLWEGYSENIPEVEGKITNTLNQITEVMRKAGYKDGSYRYVYQSYSNLFASSDKR